MGAPAQYFEDAEVGARQAFGCYRVTHEEVNTLRCEAEILGKRRSESRPEMGLLNTRMTVFNQHQAVVMTFVSTTMVATRPAEVPPARA